MRALVPALLVLGVATLAPLALAEGGPVCSGGETDADAVAVGDFWLDAAGAAAWEVFRETNGLPGLQKTHRFCAEAPGGLPRLVAWADERIGTVKPPCVGLLCGV